jgi:aminoglycoside 6'-N-acetyltransferase I
MLELEKMPAEKAHILQNLYPCYLHDLSEFQDTLPNQHGLFESDEVVSYDKETFLKIWWQHPDQLFPYIIKIDDRPAGFALIGTKPYSGDSDYEIKEFFIVNPYRKKGFAEQAALKAFGLFNGKWKCAVLPRNLPACSFWRRTISKITSSNYMESQEKTDDGEMVIFRFEN